MPGDSSRALAPRTFVLDGQWPDAALAGHHGARVAQALARRLAAAMRERGLSANRLAAASGVNRQTIANVLAGATWPDLLTIASLEAALDAELWPGRRP
ncbi:helix-turn-helix domain-containing protein [Streptomyces rectiverticillatus]|uniref:helix-turn-helix domain-containing protein n=1 Tax=Streptomyces rectiverticillatus TaxID=173860 RepID=UPI001FEB6EE8|nr:helix-turn-helix transcriptional regulator [Streptomyces rectiverticillatus]